MIKFMTFLFDEIPSTNHWASFAEFGTLRKFDVQHFDSYTDAQNFVQSNETILPLLLEKEDTYQIALDQSTSNTGIFVKNYNNTRAWMIEVSRSKGQNADDFIFDLEMFLHWFAKDGTLSHVIYERPISNDNFRSSQVLFQLEGMIRSLTRRYDEFKTVKLDFIENSSWRRVVIMDDFKNYDKKTQSKCSIEAIFDWTKAYSYSIGKDNDIYEAMGVMFGWFINSYDALGRPYVRGDKYYGAIGGFILPTFSAEQISKQFSDAGIQSHWYMQNPRKSTFENLAAAVEKYKVVCVEFTDSYSMLTLCVECNIRWMNPDKMTVVLVAANYVDDRIYQITGKEYHFVF